MPPESVRPQTQHKSIEMSGRCDRGLASGVGSIEPTAAMTSEERARPVMPLEDGGAQEVVELQAEGGRS